MVILKKLYKKVSTTNHLNVSFLSSSYCWIIIYQKLSRKH